MTRMMSVMMTMAKAFFKIIHYRLLTKPAKINESIVVLLWNVDDKWQFGDAV